MRGGFDSAHLQEYHNDLKRLGLTASQIKSLQRTGARVGLVARAFLADVSVSYFFAEHDQSYYVDIAVGIALVIIGGIIMALWP